MIKILKNASEIITVDTKGRNYKRGNELNNISVLHDHSLIIENDRIKDIIPSSSSDKLYFDESIDASGKIILPGFIESHTHLVYAGSRANEFLLKLQGSNYEEIASAGGGIMNTVKAVRENSSESLYNLAVPRVENFISQGVTALEIKSGYGLDFYNEMKILEVIKKLDNNYPVDIISTFLGAHTYPPEYKNNRKEYIRVIIEEMIPYIRSNKLADFCDGFCEKTAFSVEEITEIFLKAKEAGMGLKLHTDQFNSIGGIETALKLDAVSIDHLEVLPEKYYKILGESDVVCTLLPGVPFFLNYDFAPARDLIKNNAIVALAADYNPGSSNINNIFLIMSLAAMKMKMTVEEIISAYTINAAKSVGRNIQSGSIEIGKKADLAVLNIPDYNEIIYNIGQNFNYLTIKNGNIIWKRQEGKFENY